MNTNKAIIQETPENAPNVLYDGDFKGTPILESSIDQFFLDEYGHGDKNILSNIFSLAKEDAIIFWNLYFSQKNYRSTMELSEQDWPCQVKWYEIGQWIEDFNSSIDNSVSQLLKTQVNWENSATVYFCAGSSSILKTVWSIFLDTWMGFLEYDDEGPILVATHKREAFSFTPLGRIQMTHRDLCC